MLILVSISLGQIDWLLDYLQKIQLL